MKNKPTRKKPAPLPALDPHLQPPEWQIHREVDRVDQVAISYEAKWGIGFLQEVAPVELLAKWNAQIEKMNKAIMDNDPSEVVELVNGTIRGWKALEDAATSKGLKPEYPEVWEYETEGQKFAFVKNRCDAYAASKQKQGYAIFSLSEVASVLAKRNMKLLGDVKKIFPSSELKTMEPINWKEGDNVEM